MTGPFFVEILLVQEGLTLMTASEVVTTHMRRFLRNINMSDGVESGARQRATLVAEVVDIRTGQAVLTDTSIAFARRVATGLNEVADMDSGQMYTESKRREQHIQTLAAARKVVDEEFEVK